MIKAVVQILVMAGALALYDLYMFSFGGAFLGLGYGEYFLIRLGVIGGAWVTTWVLIKKLRKETSE